MSEIDLVPLGQQIVEFSLAANAAQRGLGQLAGGVEVVLDGDNGFHRVDHPEIDHRAHLDRDVVAGDDILRRNIHGHQPQADLLHPVEDRDQDDESRAFGAQ